MVVKMGVESAGRESKTIHKMGDTARSPFVVLLPLLHMNQHTFFLLVERRGKQTLLGCGKDAAGQGLFVDVGITIFPNWV